MRRNTRGDFDAMSAQKYHCNGRSSLDQSLACDEEAVSREVATDSVFLLADLKGGVMLNAQNNKPPLRGLGVIPIIPFEAQCAEWSGSLGRPATLLGMVFSFFLEFFLICGTL